MLWLFDFALRVLIMPSLIALLLSSVLPQMLREIRREIRSSTTKGDRDYEVITVTVQQGRESSRAIREIDLAQRKVG